jgi:hypothetical protein
MFYPQKRRIIHVLLAPFLCVSAYTAQITEFGVVPRPPCAPEKPAVAPEKIFYRAAAEQLREGPLCSAAYIRGKNE